MTETALLIPTAIALGALHSFAPDHLAAVSVFVSRKPSWRNALGLGARWGMGHSLTVVVVGGVLALSGLQLPERFESMAERAVGVVLVLLGVFAISRAQKLHGHWHEHEGRRHWHLHSHRSSDAHGHDHGALMGIGMLHGLAGTGALVVALPVAIAGSRATALIFLAAFGLGTILSMSLFSAAAGWLLSATTVLSRNVHRGAIVLAGLLSVGVGVWWMVAGGG
ncbi:MAG TPA: sulfite exporter TauE/SafE family protein [Gemmatimonadaceae bacterium]|jgi:High-affinity nickel-transport protein.